MDKKMEQMKLCEKYGVLFLEANANFKVGISKNVQDGRMPLNALRHPPEGDTTGWYIWAGNEILDHDDFFSPLHVKHLEKLCPLIVKYLGLPAGWRVLIDCNGYEDVWFDPSLIDF
jgi:hypothetical protein